MSLRLKSDLDLYTRKAQQKCLNYARKKGLSSPIHHQIVYYFGLSDLGGFCFFVCFFKSLPVMMYIKGLVRAHHNWHLNALESSLVCYCAILLIKITKLMVITVLLVR